MNATELLDLFNRYVRTVDDLAAARAERMAAFGGDIRRYDEASDKYRELTRMADRIATQMRTAITTNAAAEVTGKVEPIATELKHPGTWLPGDKVLDSDGDLVTREADAYWYLEGGHLAWTEDVDVDTELAECENAYIVSLAPRANAEAVR